MTDNLLPLEIHRELAAEALDSIAFQTTVAARCLRRGDDAVAVETYRRVAAIMREFASPSIRALASVTTSAFVEAAAEFREQANSGSIKKGKA